MNEVVAVVGVIGTIVAIGMMIVIVAVIFWETRRL